MGDHERRLNARGQHRRAADRRLHGPACPDSGSRHGVDGRAHARDLGTPRRGSGRPPAVSFEERLYNAGSEAILALVKDIEPPVRTLLVIGHNPGLHDLARLLIASGDVEARERLNEGLPTVGPRRDRLCRSGLGARLHPRGGRLERFVSPRSLADAARV